jgi:hypothetical protein
MTKSKSSFNWLPSLLGSLAVLVMASFADAGPFPVTEPVSAKPSFPTGKGPFVIPKTKDDFPPPPVLSEPEVTYRIETRYRKVAYRVRVCKGGVCGYETRYRQEAYKVRVPIASSQYVIGKGEAARVRGTRQAAAPKPNVNTRWRPAMAGRPSPVYYSQHRSSRWTWPGDLRTHLINVHGVDPKWATSASPAALMRHHDRLHGG